MEETQIATLANRPIQREENPNPGQRRTASGVSLAAFSCSPKQHMKWPCSETTRVVPRASDKHSTDTSAGERPLQCSTGMRLAQPTGPRSAT
jgi:hypothetical protein